MKIAEIMSVMFMFATLITGALLFIFDVLTFIDVLQFFILFGILYELHNIRIKLENK